jgi:hypothetical protein
MRGSMMLSEVVVVDAVVKLSHGFSPFLLLFSYFLIILSFGSSADVGILITLVHME